MSDLLQVEYWKRRAQEAEAECYRLRAYECLIRRALERTLAPSTIQTILSGPYQTVFPAACCLKCGTPLDNARGQCHSCNEFEYYWENQLHERTIITRDGEQYPCCCGRPQAQGGDQ